MTQTPASAPFGLVTTPPRSVEPIVTSGAGRCWAFSERYPAVRQAATVAATIKRWIVFVFTRVSFDYGESLYFGTVLAGTLRRFEGLKFCLSAAAGLRGAENSLRPAPIRRTKSQ